MTRTKKMRRDSGALPVRPLKVGVTLYLREGQQSLWENGIFQNCYFLLQLLNCAPALGQAVIVAGGPGNPAEAGDFLALAPSPVMTMQDAMDQLDVVIELSAQLDAQWARDFVDRGGRIVGMRVANDFVIDCERIVHSLDPGILMASTPYSEIWTLPAFEHTCAGYYAAGHRAPVRVMQHLWSPELIERAAGDQPLVYQPGRKRWRLAILEPNICSVKTCHLPLLLCDVAHRLDPHAIERLAVFNALALKDHRDFVNYARSLDLVMQGLATFEGRLPLFQIMGPMADAVISHHWENAQNYLYYEALHGGFPLIHNSRFVGACGYRYHDFDPEDGALALLQALSQHDADLESYRDRARRFLATLHPTRPQNVAAFEHAIVNLRSPDPRP